MTPADSAVGSHGNLGDRDVDAGDTVVVPWRIGEFRTTLRPIPLAERLPGEDVGGALGVVLVLMEENEVSDAGARIGYAALVDYVRKAINNDIIPKLNINKKRIEDDDIKPLIDPAIDAVKERTGRSPASPKVCGQARTATPTCVAPRTSAPARGRRPDHLPAPGTGCAEHRLPGHRRASARAVAGRHRAGRHVRPLRGRQPARRRRPGGLLPS
jgi:hypothetical protein